MTARRWSAPASPTTDHRPPTTDHRPRGAGTTSPQDRPGSALLVVDVQVDVVTGAHARDEVVSAIAGLVDRARREEVPVVWAQHSSAGGLDRGSPGWRIVPELVPAGGEPVVHELHGDSFEATELEDVLAGLGVGRVVVAGAETDACIRSTLHGAFTRGYDALLVSDAHTAGDETAWGAPPVAAVIAHTNLCWSFQSAPGRTAGTATAAEVPLRTPLAASSQTGG